MRRIEFSMLAARYAEAWDRHDADAIAECYAFDAVARDMAVAVPVQGRDAIRRSIEAHLEGAPDLRRTVRRTVCEGDLMAQEWHVTATHNGDSFGVPATGRPVEIDGCTIVQVGSDGLINALTNYWDLAGLLHQLGATREPVHGPYQAPVQPEPGDRAGAGESPRVGVARLRALVERHTAAWNGHDPDAVAACYAQDTVSRDVAVPIPLQGRAAVRASIAGYLAAFPDARRALRRIICEDDIVCAEWHSRGTHRGELLGIAPTGREVEIVGCSVIRATPDGALIQSIIFYWDVAGLLQQLGVLPEVAQVPDGV